MISGFTTHSYVSRSSINGLCCYAEDDLCVHIISVLFVTQISQCASEMLTLGTTWLYTFQLREVHRYRGEKPSVSLLLLRDGV